MSSIDTQHEILFWKSVRVISGKTSKFVDVSLKNKINIFLVEFSKKKPNSTSVWFPSVCSLYILSYLSVMCVWSVYPSCLPALTVSCLCLFSACHTGLFLLHADVITECQHTVYTFTVYLLKAAFKLLAVVNKQLAQYLPI